MTIILMFLLVYHWSIIAFFWLDHTYYYPGIGDGERTCTSLRQCYWTTINFVKNQFLNINIFRDQELIQR